MADMTFTEMQEMQRILQEKYLKKWGGLSPKKAIEKLLWLHGELGEVGDILKKKGSRAIMEEPQIREHFVEELCDVLMYYNDVLLCFQITPEELENSYRKKFQTNMSRW